ncbi:MAG: TIGR03545 family protein [Calditrichaeota bacterium]|nr:TIGR03545 family protein [Calditrichota bacterium]
MRKKGIIILVAIILIFAVIGYFTRDYRIERLIESVGQSIVGAKVELDNFHFSLFKMECSWDRLQIANKNDPWKNILETGRASVKLETRPLFWRRIIINNMKLENVRSGTARTSDGSIPQKEVSEESGSGFFAKAKKGLEKQFSSLPVFDISGMGKKLKVDSLIDVNNLLTVQGYENLEQIADSSFQYWQTQLKTQTYLTRLNELEQKLKSLKIDEMKDVQSLTTGVKKIKEIRQEANSLKKEITEKHAALSSTFSNLQTQLASVQQNLQQDVDRAKQLAHLKDLNVKDVSMLLFGEPVVGKVEQVLGYVALARKYLPAASQMKGTPEKKKPPRLKGQDIDFPFHYRYPKFLLREAKLSAATAAGDTAKAYFVEGNLTGLTNQPPVFGRPTRFDFNLVRVDGNQYHLLGSFDHRGEVPMDSLKLLAKNFALGRISLKKQKYFPAALNASKGDVELAGLFLGDKIDLSLNLAASPVKFIFEQPAKDKVSQIVRDVLNGISKITLNAKLVGESENYQLQMNSNVDRVLANQVKATLAKNLREAQSQVENYVRQQAEIRRKKVESIIQKNRDSIYAEIDNAKNLLDKKLAEIEAKKKQAEQRLEEEKKKLENKAKNKLKSFFKKP